MYGNHPTPSLLHVNSAECKSLTKKHPAVRGVPMGVPRENRTLGRGTPHNGRLVYFGAGGWWGLATGTEPGFGYFIIIIKPRRFHRSLPKAKRETPILPAALLVMTKKICNSPSSSSSSSSPLRCLTWRVLGCAALHGVGGIVLHLPSSAPCEYKREKYVPGPIANGPSLQRVAGPPPGSSSLALRACSAPGGPRCCALAICWRLIGCRR